MNLGTFQKKIQFIYGLFSNRSDPLPTPTHPYNFGIVFGTFPKFQFFFGTFGHFFGVLIHQRFGEKCPKTFGFGQPSPFST